MTVNKPRHISSVISSFAGCSDCKWWGKCHNFMCLLVCVSRHNACIRAQLCPTLCDPMDCSPLGSSLHGISQLKILRWVTIPFFRASSWPRDQKRKKEKVKSLSHVRLFVAPWTVAHQAPPSMEFSRQEYWSGLPFPSPGNLPDPGIEPRSPALQADALGHQGSPGIELRL